MECGFSIQALVIILSLIGPYMFNVVKLIIRSELESCHGVYEYDFI